MDTYGFKFNPYDQCVANNIIEGEPPTIVFRVDDLKSIHTDTKVVYNSVQWVDFMYVDPNIGKFHSVRGKIHEYLSMTLDFTKKGEVNSIGKVM